MRKNHVLIALNYWQEGVILWWGRQGSRACTMRRWWQLQVTAAATNGSSHNHRPPVGCGLIAYTSPLSLIVSTLLTFTPAAILLAIPPLLVPSTLPFSYQVPESTMKCDDSYSRDLGLLFQHEWDSVEPSSSPLKTAHRTERPMIMVAACWDCLWWPITYHELRWQLVWVAAILRCYKQHK